MIVSPCFTNSVLYEFANRHSSFARFVKYQVGKISDVLQLLLFQKCGISQGLQVAMIFSLATGKVSQMCFLCDNLFLNWYVSVS